MKNSKSFLSIAGRSGSSRPVALAAIFFIFGAALAYVAFHFHPVGTPNKMALTEENRNLLAQLKAPATVRFYSVLPAADTGLQQFSSRVGQLLDAVQSASEGKVQVIRESGETNADAAVADGIQPFNLDKGEACFLGIAVSSGGHKESLGRLQPEWESALQYDLVRAILRVAVAPEPAAVAPEIARPSLEIISNINRLVPNVNSTSLEDADRIFHQDFLKQCSEVGAEMEAKVNAAEEKLVDAQNNGSAEAVEAAKKNLQEVQLAQGEKLKEIAAQLQTELAVFRQMKSGATNSAK